MKIFLDHCVPKRLLRLLSEHEVKTAYQMDWAAKKNGELLKLVANEFEVFLTVDQNLQHQQNLASSPLRFDETRLLQLNQVTDRDPFRLSDVRGEQRQVELGNAAGVGLLGQHRVANFSTGTEILY